MYKTDQNKVNEGNKQTEINVPGHCTKEATEVATSLFQLLSYVDISLNVEQEKKKMSQGIVPTAAAVTLLQILSCIENL